MRLALLASLLVILAGVGWIDYDRIPPVSTCILTIDPQPGILDRLGVVGRLGNTDIGEDLGHFLAFTVTTRFADGRFYGDGGYHDLSAENAPLPCPTDGGIRTDFINDQRHFASLCQVPDHVVETAYDFISTSLLIRDGDTMLEVFLADDAETVVDLETSTCSMMRALQLLNETCPMVEQ